MSVQLNNRGKPACFDEFYKNFSGAKAFVTNNKHLKYKEEYTRLLQCLLRANKVFQGLVERHLTGTITERMGKALLEAEWLKIKVPLNQLERVLRISGMIGADEVRRESIARGLEPVVDRSRAVTAPVVAPAAPAVVRPEPAPQPRLVPPTPPLLSRASTLSQAT